MAKQMLIDTTRGKQTEMPPWLPDAGVHCAALIDQPAGGAQGFIFAPG